ncbi:hypothetical protein AwWohl_04150 [Gammaproteobacteria bacterium]|nr:hypothetical protein AwWohl_04150 [Gammaproteobacteria bacterium]
MIANMIKAQALVILTLSILALILSGKLAFLSVLAPGLAVFIPNCLMAKNQIAFKTNPVFLLLCMLLRPIIIIILLMISIKLLININWIWFLLSVVMTLMAIKIPFIVLILFPTHINKD